jgi:hypothetical protein
MRNSIIRIAVFIIRMSCNRDKDYNYSRISIKESIPMLESSGPKSTSSLSLCDTKKVPVFNSSGYKLFDINGSTYIATAISGTATAYEYGTGNSNTNVIVASQREGSYAAKLCYYLVLDGYSDWYLPNTKELEALYANHEAIGGFAHSDTYWSSNEQRQPTITTHEV